MFKLRKLHPPLGSPDNPVLEASYAEGEIRVVGGLCEVRLPETRDRLVKLGYEELEAEKEVRPHGASGKPKGKR